MFIYYNYLFAVIVISSNVCFSQNEGYFKHLKQNQGKEMRFAPTGHVMLHTKLDVRLMTTSQSEKEGIIEVKLENHTSYYVPICYDDSSDAALRYSYTVTHVTCRHLGFMTYQNQYSLPVSSGISYVGLKNSVYCEGHEQRLEQCYWNEFKLSPCEKVISVLCGSCVQQLHATEGLLTSPGFPHAYFYTLRCEWTITVLRDRDVALNFLDFIFPPSFTNHSCEGGDAHLDIAALDANSETYISQYTRYCSSKTPNKFQVSAGSVLINFFSGIYKQNINQNSRKAFGFRMFYQGVRKEGFSHYTLKVILTTLGIMVFLVMLAFCYFCNRHKNKIKQEKRNVSSTNRDTCHYPGVQIEQHQVITVNLQGPRNSTSSCDTCSIQHHYEEIPIQKQNEYTYLLQANMSPVEKLDSEDINNNVVIHTSDYETPILVKRKSLLIQTIQKFAYNKDINLYL
ncbi:uncharacterized protein LOC143239485 isoform X1 [Tachypleus tridentatus]|uniref:uncharacterized protein LOC143239485 isoform X1 n=1 Tax=Tachypleus tridentatus TaxID=6853 RepID=UPI003FD3F0EB